jgi:hypothetical protein
LLKIMILYHLSSNKILFLVVGKIKNSQPNYWSKENNSAKLIAQGYLLEETRNVMCVYICTSFIYYSSTYT